MDKIFQFIDKIVEKIPVHIRDIIQKGFLALGALILLLGMLYGIRRGLEDAIPGGAKIHETTQDLFYIEQRRQENMKNQQLIEDIELEQDEFQRIDERIDPGFTQMGNDVSDRLMGEKGEMIQKENPFDHKKEDEFMEPTAQSPESLPGGEQPRSLPGDPEMLDLPETMPGKEKPSISAPSPSEGSPDEELLFQEE